MSPKRVYIALHDWKTKRRMERGFQLDRDPYRPATAPERRKQAALSAVLSDRRYRAALDAGCAEGRVTRRIAPLCDRVVALDISETAIWRAMVNLADVPNVNFVRGNLRGHDESATWDLVLLSEVLPALDAGRRFSGELAGFCRDLTRRLLPGGRLVIVNEFSTAHGFRAANRYVSLFQAGTGLRLRQEILTGGSTGESRHSIAVFERPVASEAAAVLAGGASAVGAPSAVSFRTR